MRGYAQKRGDTWTVTVDLPRDPMTGKRRQRRITAHTKREAERQATALVATAQSSGFVAPNAGRLTVAEYLNTWLDSIEGTVKPISRHRYAALMRLHVTPYIGGVQLAKLSPLDLQHLYSDRLTVGKLSTTTVSNIHVILHRAFKQALRWQLVNRNVTEAIDPPRKAQPACKVWDTRQVARFLEVADKDESAALWRAALFTGMRRGELLALRWEDVDLGRGVLAVTHTYSRSAKGGFELGAA